MMNGLMVSLAFAVMSLVACRGALVAGPYEENEGLPVTRSEVILTAFEYAAVTWVMTDANKVGISCGGGFMSDYPVGQRVGMGYKWGGWDTVEEFLRKIDEGCGTGTGGNVTYQDYPFDCVTGISCTGLVSRAWHLSEKYTLSLPDHPEVPRQMHEITDSIAGVDLHAMETGLLRKGDAFLNSQHTILFVYETRDGFPMVIDARDRGVSFRRASWPELSSGGYYAIRYHNVLEEMNPAGTTANPIRIDARRLPFVHQGNTWDMVSMEFHRYSINLALNEQGPELIYELVVDQPSTISLHLSEDTALPGENDLYLLASLEKDVGGAALNSLARGDTVILHDFARGTYYVVVDSGEDKPGSFTLSIDYAVEAN